MPDAYADLAVGVMVMDDDELAQRRRLRGGRAPRPDSGSVEDDLLDREQRAGADDEHADERDDEARGGDTDAAARDRDAERRDVEADEQMTDAPPAAVRQRARYDRAEAARDRGSAVGDRGRARHDRITAKSGRARAADDRSAAFAAVGKMRELLDRAEDNAEDMLLIGQAQGKLMAAEGLDPGQALLEVFSRAARDGTELAPAALRIVEERSDNGR
jgi:hypothetical protein